MEKDYYSLWLNVPQGQRPPDHYALLNLPMWTSSTEEIEAAAYEQLEKLDQYSLSPDIEKRSACTRLMNEVAHARTVLANPQQRKVYERQLASAATQKIVPSAQNPSPVSGKQAGRILPAQKTPPVHLQLPPKQFAHEPRAAAVYTVSLRDLKLIGCSMFAGACLMLLAVWLIWPSPPSRTIAPVMEQEAYVTPEPPIEILADSQNTPVPVESLPALSPGIEIPLATEVIDTVEVKPIEVLAVEENPEQQAARLLQKQHELLAKERIAKIEAMLLEAKSNDSVDNGRTALKILDDLLKIDSHNVSAQSLRAKISSYYTVNYPGQILINSIGMKLAYIPEGEFMMGSPPGEIGRSDDELQHKVILTKPFLMGITEVTRSQWLAVMGSEHHKDYGNPDLTPLTHVTWAEAMAFCQALSRKEGRTYQLPTEAQWEYACRAKTTTAYNFNSNIITPKNANYRTSNHSFQGAFVGSYKPNQWGLYDMHGNISEWCLDSYKPYESTVSIDPGLSDFNPLAPHNVGVVRGGAMNTSPETTRSAARGKGFNGRGTGILTVGFRVVVRDNFMKSPSGQDRAKKITEIITNAKANNNPEHGRAAMADLEELLKWDPINPEATELLGQIAKHITPSKIGESLTNTVVMKMVYIPAGKFVRGGPGSSLKNQEPELVQSVKISEPFLMSATEVTQAQWRAVMGTSPSHFNDNQSDNRPVEKVTWIEANAFCEALSEKENRTYRLPTEAQWQYAGAAPEANHFDYHSDQNDFAGWHERNSIARTHPVAEKRANKFGLYDMQGNVWEWCYDWFDRYANEDTTDPIGPKTGELRIIRGGSWYVNSTMFNRQCRWMESPNQRSFDIGFRVVLLYETRPYPEARTIRENVLWGFTSAEKMIEEAQKGTDGYSKDMALRYLARILEIDPTNTKAAAMYDKIKTNMPGE